MAASANPSVTSNGIIVGDNPLQHSLLLLMVQIVVILCFSRFISFIFRPLRQPRVVAEIIGGILLGPAALGRIPGFSNAIFPQSSLLVLDTVANFGLVFFLFLVGLELDLHALSKTGGKALGVAGAGILLPFVLGIPVSMQVFKVAGMERSGNHFGFPFLLFMGVALSITAFPVLARILAERKMLNSEMGKMAIPAAALNDVVAWVLLALAIAVTNSGSSPLVILWILILGIIYLAFMFGLTRPLLYSLSTKDPVPELSIVLIFLLVLLSSFITDLIGINVIFGAFIVGLLVPKDQPISGILIEKTEDYVSILLLPLYFASSGLKIDLDSISNLQAVGAFVLVTATAVTGKVGGTVLVTKLYGMPLRQGAALGCLMSCKGLVELIVLNIGLTKGVINEEIFAIMVLMALAATFATTPMIMWLYPPARDVPPYKWRKLEATKADKGKLRMLVCLHGMRDLPSMMNLMEMSKGQHPKLLRVNALHLIEFSERSSTIRLAAASKSINLQNEDVDPQDEAPSTINVDDAVAMTLKTFGRLSRFNIRVGYTVSSVRSMHTDICLAAANRRANIIILPYHKHLRQDGNLESKGIGFLHLNQMVMAEAPCSVAILVDRGLSGPIASPLVASLSHHILMLFFGGPDDREALLLAKRMVQHGGVKLTIVHCILKVRQQPGTPSALTTDELEEKLPQNLDLKFTFSDYSKNLLWRLGVKFLRWLRAPWRGQDPNHKDGYEKSTKEQCHEPAFSLNSDDDSVRVPVTELEQENEEKLNRKILEPLLASTSLAPEDSITVILQEIMDDNLRQPIEKLLAAGPHYNLIFVGLHSRSSRSAAVHCAGREFCSGVVEQGLGPVGNLMLSMEITRSMGSSVLVVQQHHDDPSCALESSIAMPELQAVPNEAELPADVDELRHESPPSSTHPSSNV